MKGEQPKEQGKDEQRRFKRQRVEMVGQVLRVEDFFEERSREIQILEQAISQSRANQKLRVFQTVQRYQRRRAASHNPKRLPKHLRLRAIEQMQRDKNPNPGEMPRRKKRNPKRLAEFKTMGKKWLETHIWHAKRMKMVSRNGIMAALTPNQKCFRSMYRAAKNEATCVDSSWKKIIEIIGNRAELSKLLESIADPSLSSFSAEMYVFGNRAGKQFIHDKNEWPLGAICPVDFLWKPEEGDSGKTIWIWVDSYCFDVVHDFILRLKSPNINLRKIETMNRFEIDGPRSHAILSHTLVLANDNSLWNSYRDLSTPGVLQEGVVCALDIQDPRLIFPRLMPPKSGPANETSQQNLELNEIGQHALIKWPLDSARGSKIWDLEHQKGILTSRATNSEISARRSKNLVPGNPLDILESDVHVPILLIRRRSQGWDLIAPIGWGPSILNLLIFAGIRVGGIKEMENYQFECGHPSFPTDYPESVVQDELAVAKEDSLMKRHLTKPKGRRPGFNGIENPFKARFCEIIGQESGPVSVLHSPHVVNILDSIWNKLPRDFNSFKQQFLKDLTGLIKLRPNFRSLKNLNNQVLDKIFVRVYLSCNSGNLKEDSIIHTSLDSDELDIPIPKDRIIGYTTRANFSLLNRKCTAIGSCLLKGIFDSYKSKSVYIRSRTDRKSRIAFFNIIP